MKLFQILHSMVVGLFIQLTNKKKQSWCAVKKFWITKPKVQTSICLHICIQCGRWSMKNIWVADCISSVPSLILQRLQSLPDPPSLNHPSQIFSHWPFLTHRRKTIPLPSDLSAEPIRLLTPPLSPFQVGLEFALLCS